MGKKKNWLKSDCTQSKGCKYCMPPNNRNLNQ